MGLGVGRDGITIPSVGKGWVGGAADLERGQAASDGASGRHGNVVPTRGMGGQIGLGVGRDGITIPSVGKGSRWGCGRSGKGVGGVGRRERTTW